MPQVDRLPDFMIIGRMKCGTTTLSEWLRQQPDVFFSRIKEPQFFSTGLYEQRGLSWYRGLFKGATEGQLLGEGSTSSTGPELAPIAAERIASMIPDVRLIYLVRHPAERIRSHYRHMRLWRDESRPFAQAMREGGPFIDHTMYHRCLLPYIEGFPREQILVQRMEDLSGNEGSAWDSVLDHLGLPRRPAPDTAHNVSADRGMKRAPMRLMRQPLMRRRLTWVPRGLRRHGKRLLLKRGAEFQAMLEDSRSPIDDSVLEPVWDDIRKLEAWLGLDIPLWPREPEHSEQPLDELYEIGDRRPDGL